MRDGVAAVGEQRVDDLLGVVPGGPRVPQPQRRQPVGVDVLRATAPAPRTARSPSGTRRPARGRPRAAASCPTARSGGRRSPAESTDVRRIATRGRPIRWSWSERQSPQLPIRRATTPDSTRGSTRAAGRVVIRCTAKVRTSSARWSWAVSWPPSTESGSTTRSATMPWLSTKPMRTAVPASIASRSAASEPLGRQRGRGRGPGRGAPRSPDADRGDRRRRPGRVLAGRRGGRAARLAGCAPAARRGGPTRTVPSAASTTGATPSSRSRGSSTSSGSVLTSTVGAIRRSPSEPACGWCSSSASAVSSSDAQERLGVPDPDGAERAHRVVDEVGQRLRDRRPRDRVEEGVQLGGRPADVERAAYGPGREAVDRRAAARLDVGDAAAAAGPAPTRAGPARRRSGRPGSARGRPARAAARRAAARGSSPASSAGAYDASPPSPVTPERPRPR